MSLLEAPVDVHIGTPNMTPLCDRTYLTNALQMYSWVFNFLTLEQEATLYTERDSRA